METTTPILTVAEARYWLNLYDNGEEEDIKTNTQLQMLIGAAEGYVEDATGPWYKATPKLISKTKLVMLMLVSDWNDNRSYTRETSKITQVSDKLRQTISGTILQIQLGNPEVVV